MVYLQMETQVYGDHVATVSDWTQNTFRIVIQVDMERRSDSFQYFMLLLLSYIIQKHLDKTVHVSSSLTD
jgi:hypothetical protein